jgi:AraC-like DNA-binding protein
VFILFLSFSSFSSFQKLNVSISPAISSVEGESVEDDEEKKYLSLSSTPSFLSSIFQWIETSLLHQHSLIDLSIVSNTPHRRNVSDSFYYHFSLGFQQFFLSYLHSLSESQLQQNPSLSSLILFELKNLEIPLDHYNLTTFQSIEKMIKLTIDKYDGKVSKPTTFFDVSFSDFTTVVSLGFLFFLSLVFFLYNCFLSRSLFSSVLFLFVPLFPCCCSSVVLSLWLQQCIQ